MLDVLLCVVFGRDCRWLHFDLKGFNVYWSQPQQNPFNLSPEVSWGGIKNQSKSTWCQSALIQFSINKTFQTALKMAQEIYVFAHCHGERNYLTIIYLLSVKEVSLTPLFHHLTKDWIVCVRVDVGIPEIGLMPVNISFITGPIVEGTLAPGAM